jgi:hypothetical protein
MTFNSEVSMRKMELATIVTVGAVALASAKISKRARYQSFVHEAYSCDDLVANHED